MSGCGTCGAELRPGDRFCAQCGAAQALPCPSCGAENPPGNRFCPACGTELATGPGAAGVAVSAGAVMSAARPGSGSERRLVSVLFADLVGFTTLSEHRDPEAVRDLLSQYFDRCRTLIERYGGTVEKFIGDAVMAVWGTPVAREDDAERSVRAALALTQAVTLLGEEVGMPGLRVRAGVLTGSAAVDLSAEGEGMVLGDTVNTASRLQSIAEPGTVLVDDVTRRASEAAIAYEDAGEHTVKGREQPVRAWTALRVVAGAGGARRGAGLEAPFVGRDRELETIIALSEQSAGERAARLVTVTGDAGAGKSRLLWEFFKYVDGIEAVRWWHQGRCLSYGDGVAYWAMAEMIRSRAGIVEEEGAASARAKLGETIARYVSEDRERRLIEPRLAQLLGFEQRGGREAADLFSGWRLFFERMSEEAPVILAFEDLQWADSGLLDFVDYLLEWSADHPIFILALGRTELEKRRPDWGTALRLDPLEPAAMRSLLDGLVPGLPGDVGERIRDRAEGVPLYAVETVRMLLDRGLLIEADSRYSVTGTIEELDVPETLQALVAARLDNLAPAERALLQDAAVLGLSFTPAALAAVSERREVEIRTVLDSLVAKQVLGRNDDQRSGEQGQYHFLQALLRTIALGTLGRRERKARHLAAAEHLSSVSGDSPEIAEVLASHYLDAVAAEPEAQDAAAIRERARETLVAAGRRALSLALGDEARTHFERAASLTEDPVQAAMWLAEAGTAAAQTGAYEAAEQLLTGAVTTFDQHGAGREAASARLRLASLLIDLNRLEDAGEALERIGDAASDPELRAERFARRAQIGFLRGDYELAYREAEAALEISDTRHLQAVTAEAAMTKGIALYFRSRMTEAGALMALALQVARDGDLTPQMLRAYYNYAINRLSVGDGEHALQLIESGLALAHERGNRPWERSLLSQRVEARLILGDWEGVLADRARLRDGAEGDSAQIATAISSVIHSARGDRAELEEIVAHEVALSEWAELANLQRMARGLAQQTVGSAQSAVALIEQVAQTMSGQPENSSGAFLPDVIDTLLRAGKRDLLRAVVAGREHPASPLIEPQLLAGRAALHADEGEPELAEQTFREALEAMDRLQVPYFRSRCLFNFGSFLSDNGRVSEAEPIFSEARELFSSLGATPWVERVDTRLAALSVAVR